MARDARRRMREQARAARVDHRRTFGPRLVAFLVAYVAISSLVLIVMSRWTNPSLLWFWCGFSGGAVMLFVNEASEWWYNRRVDDEALAEEWATSEVRKLAGRGWHVVDHIPFHDFDVDQVAIGPGGIIVLETTWTAHRWTGRLDEIRHRAIVRACRQLHQNIAPIDDLLLQHGCSTTSNGAAIVACGPGRPDDVLELDDGTTVIPAHRLGEYLADLPRVLDPADARCAVSALTRFVELRLRHEAALQDA